MPENRVLFDVQGHVALVTLNSSAQRNAIDSGLAQELIDVCRRVSEDDEIYVVVVTGSGDSFCEGGLLERSVVSGKELEEAIENLGDESVRYEIASAIALVDRPVIAAINGDALNQGLEIALGCDVRIAAESAHFGFPSIAAGLMPMDGGTQRLPRLIGKSKSIELLLGSRVIDAKEALDIGLVSQVLPKAELLDKVMTMAGAMATKAPISLRYVKEAVNKGMDLTLDQGVRLEADLYFLIHTTEDRTEGIQAFQQKRKPEFKGK
jgi:enoyl-CoA hydratase/carnithine racemase